jgi:hypothetical protein
LEGTAKHVFSKVKIQSLGIFVLKMKAIATAAKILLR